MGDVVPLTIVRPRVCHLTVDTLKILLHEAEAGRLSGFAFVAIFSGKAGIQIDATGAAISACSLTRVALKDLDDKLARLR